MHANLQIQVRRHEYCIKNDVERFLHGWLCPLPGRALLDRSNRPPDNTDGASLMNLNLINLKINPTVHKSVQESLQFTNELFCDNALLGYELWDFMLPE